VLRVFLFLADVLAATGQILNEKIELLY
jgi:hypothetical protein